MPIKDLRIGVTEVAMLTLLADEEKARQHKAYTAHKLWSTWNKIGFYDKWHCCVTLA